MELLTFGTLRLDPAFRLRVEAACTILGVTFTDEAVRVALLYPGVAEACTDNPPSATEVPDEEIMDALRPLLQPPAPSEAPDLFSVVRAKPVE